MAPVEVNYRTADELRAAGLGSALEGASEQPGYSTFLDLTALGRQEDWEEPKGRAASVPGAIPDFAT